MTTLTRDDTNAGVSIRSYFSTVHLWAACNFADKAKAIELSSPRGYYIEHRAYVVGSIIQAAAYLEAAINEVFVDCRDGHIAYVSPLPTAARHAMKDTWLRWHSPRRRSVETLEKYQAALDACSLERFSKGDQPYQDAALALELRNALVHFTPRSSSACDPHSLGDSLKSKFEPNQLTLESTGNPYFPHHCLGCGSAKWATIATRKFADEFFARLTIRPNYQVSGFVPEQPLPSTG